MSEFNPGPNERVVIGGHLYTVMPHPAVPAFAFGQEGRKAFVFQIAGGSDNGLYALKKFKQAYRVAELVDVNDSLARFSSWPGLEVCYRQCIQFGSHDDILNQFPDLEYAVLMPWISGRTWYDIVVNGTPLTRLESLTFANAAAQVLAALEESQLAHCDIAAANVIVNGATGRAHLIDVEDIYAPGFAPPAALPAGTEGYAHKTSAGGQWGPAADRFAGAVLIAEMMAWHVPDIRKKSDEEHYFSAAEMQTDCPRYQIMRDVLSSLERQLAELFERAWLSETLDECPNLREWQEMIGTTYHQERLAKVVSDWQPLTIVPVEGEADVASRTLPEPAPAAPVPPPEPIRHEQIVPTSPPAVRIEPAHTPSPAIPVRTTPAPASQPSRPITPAVGSSQDGPVKEWRPLTIPAQATPGPAGSPTGSDVQVQQPGRRPQVTFEPILPPRPLPEVGPAVEPESEDERRADIGEPESLAYPPQRPVLYLSHVEEERPYLVWTEVMGATRYVLEESPEPDFASANQYVIEHGETRWQKPRRLNPFRRRPDALYYRVRALIDEQPGEWSDTLVVAPADL